MRRVIGPVLTTGVALAAAAVVAANPVMGSRADVQIRQVDFSSAGIFDPDFLKAIAPTPPESANPLAALKGLVSALVADAAYLGQNGVRAFGPGATAANDVDVAASPDLFGIRPADPANAVPLAAPSEPVPVTREVVTGIIRNPGSAVPPADPQTAGVVVPPADPQAAIDAARQIVHVDLPRTFDNAASLVSTLPFSQPLADAITAVGQQLASLPVILNSSAVGDTNVGAGISGTVARLNQPSNTPAVPPPTSPQPGSESTGGVTKPVGGGKIFRAPRNVRRGLGQTGAGGPGGSPGHQASNRNPDQ